MSNHLSSLLKQAITTFTCKNDVFWSNFQILTSIMDQTTAEHVKLMPQLMSEQLWNQPGKAPVSCVEIYEDKLISVGIFILKPGGKLPLHNHPEMYGLIKVIAGSVRIASYSINTEKTKEVDQRSLKEEEPAFSLTRKSKLLTAELVSIKTVNTASPTCTLEPYHKNLHEIQSLDGPAAFLDILAPPYDTPIDGNGPRQCTYYTKLSQVAPRVYKLTEIRAPSWYWTDPCPYTGPELVLE